MITSLQMKKLSWLPAISWTVALTILLTREIDPESLVWVPDHTDKLVHFTAFALLAWLWFFPLWWTLRLPLTASLWLAFLSATLFGAGMEYVQSTLPEREACMADALANALGAATIFTALHNHVRAVIKHLVALCVD